MTTPIMHLGVAVFTTILVRRLLMIPMSDRSLILASFGAFIPDIVDKLITGSRYPLHSLVLMIPLIIGINLFIQKKYPDQNRYRYFVLLTSISMLTHPFMDLEQPIPLFYPLILEGFSLNFSLIIQQGFPPVITEFVFQLIPSPFNYDLYTPHEGMLFSGLDLLGLTILFCTVVLTLFTRKITTSNRPTASDSMNQ